MGSLIAGIAASKREARPSGKLRHKAMTKVAVVGGTSLLQSTVFSHLTPTTIETPHGNVILHVDDKDSLVFLQRHHADADAGADTYRPPHLINHRANFAAILQQRVDAIVAVCSVGSLNKAVPPGTLICPDDYFYLFGPSYSYSDDATAHIVPTIDKDVRSLIIDAVKEASVDTFNPGSAVYVQTVGPRFETPAEVRFLTTVGDIIGMTGSHEATISKELNMKYAILAMVDNMGNGLSEKQLTHDEFKASVKRHQGVVETAIDAIVKRLLQHNF